MKFIPQRVLISSLFAILAGAIVIIISHFLNSESIVAEVLRDIGIAFAVAGIVSIIYEWSTRRSEKEAVLKEVLDASLSTLLPAHLWEEIKQEVFKRGFYRTNLDMEVEILDGERDLDIREGIVKIPENFIVLKSIIRYDLVGMLNREFYVPLKVHLDEHMRNNDLKLPIFLLYILRQNGVIVKRINFDLLQRHVNRGCLTMDGVEMVKVSNDGQTQLEIHRYELVSIPGLYTMVFPEMVMPKDEKLYSHPESATDRTPTIKVKFINQNAIEHKIDTQVETWFSSKGHQFIQSGNEWYFNGIMLPGQGFSIIFTKK